MGASSHTVIDMLKGEGGSRWTKEQLLVLHLMQHNGIAMQYA